MIVGNKYYIAQLEISNKVLTSLVKSNNELIKLGENAVSELEDQLTQTKKLLDEAKRIFKDIIDMPGVEFDTDFAVSDWLEKYEKENK